MTDTAATSPAMPTGHTEPTGPDPATLAAAARRKRVRARNAAEKRFQYLGIGAVLLAGLFLVILMSTIVGKGLPAFWYNYAKLPIDLSEVSTEEPGKANYNGIFKDSLKAVLPHLSDRRGRKLARSVFAAGADYLIRNDVVAEPSMAGGKTEIQVPLSDFADLYLKGDIGAADVSQPASALDFSKNGDRIELTAGSDEFAGFLAMVTSELQTQSARLKNQIDAQMRGLAAVEQRIAASEAPSEEDRDHRQTILGQIERMQAEREVLQLRIAGTGEMDQLDAALPSLLIEANGGFLKVAEILPDRAIATELAPLTDLSQAPGGEWKLYAIETPEARRKFSDAEIAAVEYLQSQGRIETGVNRLFFTAGASREPEQAGIWGATVGSILTLAVTLLLSFPIGVAAALYLEEFAPKNRLTDLIEVNINNLAAVPSIVFGLLGLAVFLNWFAMPRSAPLVGGMVLALMTLPTIIIAARSALAAVPPSIREAALGVGASRLQTVFHHVLPLAMPGILTGTIIGMARALGETAPLLMIGMVAFIVDIPGSLTDPATVLPVQIYMWADFPELAFGQKMAAAIIVLLVFLIAMNLTAIILRNRFERRW